MSSPHAGDRTPLMPDTLESFEEMIALRPQRRERRRRVGRSIGFGVVFALAGGTALAASGTWQPFGAGSEDRYTFTDAPADQKAALAVLRRPQSLRDRGPLMTAFLQRYPPGTAGRVYLRSVRELRSVEVPTAYVDSDGARSIRTERGLLVLVPNEEGSVRFGVGSAQAVDAGSLCMFVIQDAWPKASVTPSDPTAPSNRPTALGDRITGAGTCASPTTLRTDGLLMGAFSGGTLTGLVPDGVSSVRATTRDGQAVTTRVSNNSFQLLAPGRNGGPDPAMNGPNRPDLPGLAGQFKHQSLEWLGPSGAVIRRVPR